MKVLIVFLTKQNVLGMNTLYIFITIWIGVDVFLAGKMTKSMLPRLPSLLPKQNTYATNYPSNSKCLPLPKIRPITTPNATGN